MVKLFCIILLLAPLGAGKVVGLRFPQLHTPFAQVVFVLAAAAAIAFVWWCYRREASYVPPARKRLLAGLRTATVLVILFICSGCFVELARAQEVKGRILLLVDSSQSMSIVDQRTTPEEVAEARDVVGGAASDEAAKLSRGELVKAAFANPALDLVGALGERFTVEAYTFGQAQSLSPIALEPEGGRLAKLGVANESATQLGMALVDAGRRAKGRVVDAVVVLSDGGWNRGDEPVPAAAALGIPVHTVGVGLPQARDLEVAQVFCEDVVFKNDRFAFEVRMRAHGYDGRTATLRITRRDEQGVEETIKDEPVELGAGGELVRNIDVQADREGLFTYAAELTPFPDESNKLNNRKAKSNVQVVDRKLQVLLIDDLPRWEFRFIRGILEADRQRLSPWFVLRQGDDTPPDGRFLRNFPATAAELRKFDCVIIGDIPSGFVTGEEMRLLEKWVRADGGGLMVLAGRNFMPGAFADTLLAPMLPIEVEPQPAWSLDDELGSTISAGFRPLLTPEGQRFAPLRFALDAAENSQQWAEAQSLFWSLPVKRLKPGGAAYLVHPDLRLADGSPMPVLAGQRYGKGQVLFSATDETWRWRAKPGAAQHRRLWGQLVGHLALPHLLGGSSRARLVLEKGEFGIGERATVVARVLDQNYNPLADASVIVTVEHELQREQVTLTARKDQPGTFAGEWVPPNEGRFRMVLAGNGDDPGDTRQVVVVPSRLELDDRGMRADLLRQIAQAGNGTFITLAHLGELAETLKTGQKEGSVRREERSLWNAPGVLILLALLLGLEWFLRKRSDLL